MLGCAGGRSLSHSHQRSKRGSVATRTLRYVEYEVLGFDVELVQVGLVDQLQDLADIVVGKAHVSPRLTLAPKVVMTAAIAELGAGFGLGPSTPVTGRDCRRYSPSGAD